MGREWMTVDGGFESVWRLGLIMSFNIGSEPYGGLAGTLEYSMDGNNSSDKRKAGGETFGAGVGGALPVTETEEWSGASRRRFLVAGAASWASISLAGCSGLGGGEPDEEEEPIPTFVVTDEVVVGSEGIPEGAEGLIRPGSGQRIFLPGMQVIFKVGVWDPESNAIVSDEALDEVVVDLDLDESIDLSFYRDDREWSGEWQVPEDAEPGTVEYSVEVTDSANFTHTGVLDREFEIVDFEFITSEANYVATVGNYVTNDHDAFATGGFVASCMPQYQFAPGMKVGFEVGVFDGGTGERIGEGDVEEVVVEMENGDTVELSFNEDGGLWRGTWAIPEDQEPGEVTYEVQIVADTEVHQLGHRSRHAVAQDLITVIDPDAE